MKGEVFVGIDVSKEKVDVAVRPTGEKWEARSDEQGRKELVQRLRKLSPTLVVLEATGGYEVELALALTDASVPVRIMNPRQDLAESDRLARQDRWFGRGNPRRIRQTYRPQAQLPAERRGA